MHGWTTDSRIIVEVDAGHETMNEDETNHFRLWVTQLLRSISYRWV